MAATAFFVCLFVCIFVFCRVKRGKWDSGVNGTLTISWPQSRTKSGDIPRSVPLTPTPYVLLSFHTKTELTTHWQTR